MGAGTPFTDEHSGMTEEWLHTLIAEIPAGDRAVMSAAQMRLDGLAKPPGSLGGLEALAVRLAGCTGTLDFPVAPRCVLVFAADNGVVAEGVASGPQALTAIQTENMLCGLTGVAVLARTYGCGLWVTDVGVAAQLTHPHLRARKVAWGTGNIARGPAMTRSQALQALQIGVETAQDAGDRGFRLLGVGEMGIGNTTTSSAVLATLLGLRGPALETVVGRGAGLDDLGYAKKLDAVARALAVNAPDAGDPVDVLAKVGGLDLCAMTGAFLGGARRRLPMVVDGLISLAAALCAVRLCPQVTDHLFPSHRSHERGAELALAELGLPAYLQLGLRLGEGSGCPLLFCLADGAQAVLTEMGNFCQAGIDPAYLAAAATKLKF